MSSLAATNSAAPIAVSPSLATPALFTLDVNGVILTASSSACSFWSTTATTLAQTPLNRLFVAECDANLEVARPLAWDTILLEAVNGPLGCCARTAQRPYVPVRLRLEEAIGEPVRYFAIVERADASMPSVTGSQSPIPAAAATPVLVDSGLALLADHGAVGFFDLHFKAEQVYYSPAWKRMLGYAETELANTYDSWLRLLHPEDSAAAPDHVGRRQNRGIRSFGVEVRMLHRRGHYVWVHCLGTQVFGPHGDLERVTGLQIDISERKELEELSLVNEERVQRVADEGELALFDLDFGAQKFWFSPAWARLVGTEVLEGLPALNGFVEALPPDHAVQGAHAFFVEPNVGQPTFLQTLKLRKPDGSSVAVLFGAHRQLSRKGELLRVVGFCCPLPESTAEIAATPFPPALVGPVLGGLAEGVMVADGQGKVLFVNECAGRLTGFANDQAVGKPLEDIFRLVYADTGNAAREVLDNALTQNDETRLFGDFAVLTANEERPRRIVWSARRIYTADGVSRGVIIVFRDPDEMNLTPEELLRINRFETLGVVAGGISHDFNNLLTTILGGISQAKDNKDYNYLADSERACMAAKALTKQLLAIAKGGKSEVIQTISILDAVRDAVRLGRAGTNADIRIDIPDTISAVSVDRSQILQVFQNLIINALQAMPARGGKLVLSGKDVTLTDGQVGELAAGDYLLVEVRDNGCGIAAENLQKIFEPFFTTKKHGTGLGLSMVRSIVRKFGGEVTVSSVVGEGTAFQVYLPQANSPVDPMETRKAPTLRFGTGRVLLMDDDPDICRLAEGMLASLDYKYDIVRNGEEAVALYRRYLNVGRPYDAVLLDLTVVGGAGGEETFHALRELDKNVRAIVCTGYDSEDMIQHYLGMGFLGYLTKPFRVGDLGKALKNVVG